MKLRSLLTAGTVTAIDKLTLFGLLFPDEHESLPVQCCASPGASYDSVSVCVCLSQVGVLSKRMNELSWFLAWELPSIHPTPC